MKITKIDTLYCDAGWQPWTFVKVQTDAGITGYGECFERRTPWAMAGCIRDLETVLVGRDPRPVERLYWDMRRLTRQSVGGIAHKAIGGIDSALWDIKAKALGVPVYELAGGPTRDRVRVYWSHCGTTRANHHEAIGAPPIRSMADIAELGKEVVRRGFTALKTNIVIPGNTTRVYGLGGGSEATDLNINPETIRRTVELISTFREAVGDDIDICLDLNFNFKTEGFIRIAKALEPFNLMWVEIDTYDPQALLQIKQSSSTPVCSGECLFATRAFQPFFELHAMDVAMIDVPWNGFTESKRIGNQAETYEVNIAPHNRSSHLASLICAHLCAVLPNVRIMELDVEGVPWRDEAITEPLEIVDGHLVLPTKPGWGADLNEKELAKHPWPK